jgi:drug/metabolite transporter (DMT)-like permease
MTPATKAQLQINLCVLLWGFTAILGKLISLPALPLVWSRMLLVVVALTLLAPLMPWMFPAFAGPLLVLPEPRDLVLLLVLALACTLFPEAKDIID